MSDAGASLSLSVSQCSCLSEHQQLEREAQRLAGRSLWLGPGTEEPKAGAEGATGPESKRWLCHSDVAQRRVLPILDVFSNLYLLAYVILIANLENLVMCFV